MPRSRLPTFFFLPLFLFFWSRVPSACLPLQHTFVRSVGMSVAVDMRYWILVLVMAPCFCRRCSRSWLLWRKCKLHFSHWRRIGERGGVRRASAFFFCCCCRWRFVQSSLFNPKPKGDLHGRASLQCGCAGGSSTSVGGESEFHRSHTDMASHPCGLAHGRGDEQPATHKTISLNQTEWRVEHLASVFSRMNHMAF